MMYPTQEFVKAQIKADRWPAQPGEILDIRSLSDREVKIIELYNQEEIIKQLKRIGDLLEGQPKPKKRTVNRIISDLLDDGQLNNSVEK
ncbi:hypothetical protein [Methanolobus psychrotolerans]|uniref:hypothetical protein n=1 Tax=Methanolobus psychrotolerans TaxID=1874706 RepID=UPI000B918533|nr:hypothetical protein [Methanolobus psychrotolerans]